MNRRRLRKLAKFLREEVPKKRFDMRIWGEDGFEKNKCGTSACALGWTTVCFPRSKIEFVGVGAFDDDLYIEFEGEEGIEAAMLFFNLDAETAEFLFGGGFQRTPKQKAKEIEDLLAGKLNLAWG